MLAYNVSRDDLERAAKAVGVLAQVGGWKGKGLGFTLSLGPSKVYQRRSHRGRKIHAVCWHGHRDFFRALFRIVPEARIQSSFATYRDAAHFEATFEQTGYHNCGSVMEPMPYREACACAMQEVAV